MLVPVLLKKGCNMKNKKSHPILIALVSSAITAGVLCFCLISVKNKFVTNNNDIMQIIEAKNFIEQNFYKEVDEQQLIDSSLKGLVSGLDDDYATYMTPDEYESTRINDQGSLTGIGITVMLNDDEKIEIISVSENSPAQKAGISEGDFLVAVDNVESDSVEYNELINMVKGEVNTDVKITVERNGKRIDKVITREIIETITVEYEMLDNNIAYIKLSGFKENTYEQFEKALDFSKNADGIIIDVRNNGGGLLSSCEDCLDPLLPEGDIATATYQGGKTEVIVKSDENEINTPIAVLINENSASAAELFASALRDFNKAELVGTQSFGKGIMQTTTSLSNGGGLKITVATYKTAKSECYHGIGLTPDYKIELSEDTDISKPDIEKDAQLKKAFEILKNS